MVTISVHPKYFIAKGKVISAETGIQEYVGSLENMTVSVDNLLRKLPYYLLGRFLTKSHLSQ